MAWGTVSYLPHGIHPVIWSTAAAYIALFVVTALTKPTKQEIAAFDHAMAVQEPIDPNLSDSHMIKIAVGLLVFGAIFFAFVLYLSTCCVAVSGGIFYSDDTREKLLRRFTSRRGGFSHKF